MRKFKIQLYKKILKINKVCKSSKGFSSIGYSVLVVIGDGRGGVGFGKARGKDQSSGIIKSFIKARNNFFRVSIKNGTIFHEIIGKHASTIVLMIPSKFGSKISAGGCARSIFNVMGIKNITCKVHGSTNSYNVVKAIINAFINLSTPLYIAKKRNLCLKNFFY